MKDSTEDEAPVEFDEPLLVLWGPIGWRARVVVRGDQLTGEPTSALERMAGAAPFLMRLTEGLKVEGRPNSSTLVVSADGQSRRLTGKAGGRLYTLLSERQRGGVEDLGPDLEVLHGAVRRIGAGLGVSGECRLGTSTLRFRPSGRGGGGAFDAEVILPLAELRAVERMPDGASLSLSGAGVELRLEGTLISAIYVCLRAMGFEGDRAPSVVVPPWWSGVATLVASPINRAGFLSIGPPGVFFVDRTLGSALSAEGYRAIEPGALLSAELSGTNEPTLRFSLHQGEPVELHLSHGGLSLDALAQLMSGRGASLSAAWGGVKHRALDARLKLTDRSLAALLADHSDAFAVGRALDGVAVVAQDGRALRRGWLILLSTGLLFVAADELPEHRWLIEGARFERSRSGVEGDHTLRLVEGARERRVICPQPPELVQSLWRVISDARPGVAALRERYPHLDKLAGPVQQVRLANLGVELFSARGASLMVVDQGLSVRLGQAVPPALSAGLRVNVEVTQDKVVFAFRSHIVRVGAEEGGAIQLVLSAPDELEERENTRQNFRVTFLGEGLAVPLRGLADRRPVGGPALQATMVDLSASGVAVRVPEAQSQPVAQVLRLRLPLAGSARDELVGEVVHVRDGPEDSVILGCRFLEPTAALQRDLQAAVFKMQLREMSMRREEEDGGGTGGEAPTEATVVVGPVPPKRRI